MIERRIVIGLITNTAYLQKIEAIWDNTLIESPTALRLASWCWEYYQKYNKAPGRDIENIFIQKSKEGLNKDIAEELENDILSNLSEEYENEDMSTKYLFDLTFSYFKERRLQALGNTIQGLLADNKIEDAENAINEYMPYLAEQTTDIDLSDPKILPHIQAAFKESTENIIYYPGAFGNMINRQLIRGGFVAFLAPEKRGKTFFLLDIAMRARKQGRKVAFFQAGDMTEAQQIRRIAIYLAKKSDQEDYIGTMYEPVKDCIHNQMDTCDKPVRECNFGIFEHLSIDELKMIKKEELITAFKDNKTYKACHNCSAYNKENLGVPWLKKVHVGNTPLSENEAIKYWEDFFIKNKRHFKLSSHANGTLSIKKMQNTLKIWAKHDNFIPSVILTDYADLFDGPGKDNRDKQNEIWKGHRRITQETNALVITVTQADADAYKRNLLKLDNYSEDKRKYAHVTAFYGMNQDPEGREKAIGLLRFNELLIREGEFNIHNQVTVLQNLKRGRAFLSSYKSI